MPLERERPILFAGKLAGLVIFAILLAAHARRDSAGSSAAGGILPGIGDRP